MRAAPLDLRLVGAERAVASSRQAMAKPASRPQYAGDRRPVRAGADGLAARADRPVDGVVLRDRVDPARHELGLHERRREERQRQLQERAQRRSALSSLRVTSASALDSAANAVPSRPAATTSTDDAARRRRRTTTPIASASTTMISDCTTSEHEVLQHAPADDRHALDRRDEQAVGDAAVEVVDHRHAVPAAGEERRHDEHAGHEELLVVAALKAGDLDDALETARRTAAAR